MINNFRSNDHHHKTRYAFLHICTVGNLLMMQLPLDTQRKHDPGSQAAANRLLGSGHKNLGLRSIGGHSGVECPSQAASPHWGRDLLAGLESPHRGRQQITQGFPAVTRPALRDGADPRRTVQAQREAGSRLRSQVCLEGSTTGYRPWILNRHRADGVAQMQDTR